MDLKLANLTSRGFLMKAVELVRGWGEGPGVRAGRPAGLPAGELRGPGGLGPGANVGAQARPRPGTPGSPATKAQSSTRRRQKMT